MHFSILHLSDLHRDLGDELETNALLNSLERDAERYDQETPTIARPAVLGRGSGGSYRGR